MAQKMAIGYTNVFIVVRQKVFRDMLPTNDMLVVYRK
jgi:hypothetical protein